MRRRQSLGSIAPRGRRKKAATAPSKGASRGSVKNLISTLNKVGMDAAKKAKKKIAYDKARGITYSKPAPKGQAGSKSGLYKGKDGIYRTKPKRKKKN